MIRGIIFNLEKVILTEDETDDFFNYASSHLRVNLASMQKLNHYRIHE